jgi:hypothetical protein
MAFNIPFRQDNIKKLPKKEIDPEDIIQIVVKKDKKGKVYPVPTTIVINKYERDNYKYRE